MDRCQTRQGLSDKSLITQVIVLCAINILPTLIAIVGNALCIIALVKTPSLQTTSNIWVGALCISDVIVGSLAQPLYYGSLLSMITGKGIHDMWLASTNVNILLTSTSFFMAYFVTLDRYIAICYPFWYARAVTKKWCIFGGFLAFLLSIPANIAFKFSPTALQYYIPSVIVFIGLQIMIFYCRIYACILRQRRHIVSVLVYGQSGAKFRRRNTEKRRAYTIGIILLLMLISYGPLSVVKVFFEDETSREICGRPAKTMIVIAWGQFFVLLNSAMNPIVYCFRIRDIRNAITRLFQSKQKVNADDSSTESKDKFIYTAW